LRAAWIGSLANGHPRVKIELVEFPADWAKDGRHAALIRNDRMLSDGKPDLVVAFPGGRGTWHTCAQAEKLGIPVKILTVSSLRCEMTRCRTDGV
jgi:hypothetical protein